MGRPMGNAWCFSFGEHELTAILTANGDDRQRTRFALGGRQHWADKIAHDNVRVIFP